MAKDERIDARVEASLKADLQAFADRERRPLANYVAAVLAEHVEARKKREARKVSG